jgi:hypothetical protein
MADRRGRNPRAGLNASAALKTRTAIKKCRGSRLRIGEGDRLAGGCARCHVAGIERVSRCGSNEISSVQERRRFRVCRSWRDRQDCLSSTSYMMAAYSGSARRSRLSISLTPELCSPTSTRTGCRRFVTDCRGAIAVPRRAAGGPVQRVAPKTRKKTEPDAKERIEDRRRRLPSRWSARGRAQERSGPWLRHG